MPIWSEKINFVCFVISIRFIGLFDFGNPLYIARDPDVIRQLTVKDFDYFEDHRSFVDSNSDKLFGNSLFMLRGKRWRDMRATLSPAFTGSKMRQMFDLVSECGEDMAKYFLKEANAKRKIEWEMKDLFSRYTNDVIASCAFGLKVNSFEDRTNEFFMIGSTIFQFRTLKTGIRLILLRILPRLMRALDIELFSKRIGKFFRSMVLDTMTVRAEKNIIRPDMINILMQVRSGSTDYHNTDESAEKNGNDGFATVEESDIGKMKVHRQWNDDEIVSQCFLFFAAGFDTTSTLLTFVSYELAINPDIQTRLFNEVLATSESIGGKRLNYDSLQKMKYMDQVVSETLRKWPAALLTDRLCNRDYVYDNGEDTKFLIEKGRVVWIPICAIHRDPNYWPDPEKFDPERFNDENKKNIVPGTFLGFGNGPRNCIGQSQHCQHSWRYSSIYFFSFLRDRFKIRSDGN